MDLKGSGKVAGKSSRRGCPRSGPATRTAEVAMGRARRKNVLDCVGTQSNNVERCGLDSHYSKSRLYTSGDRLNGGG